MSSLKILISSLEYSIAQIYRCLKQISRPLGHLEPLSPETISLSRTSTQTSCFLKSDISFLTPALLVISNFSRNVQKDKR